MGTDGFNLSGRENEDERFDAYALLRWADDGGCCPIEMEDEDHDHRGAV